MNAPEPVTDWIVANQRWLVARFVQLKSRLRGADAAELAESDSRIAQARAAVDEAPALEALSHCLDLSQFEQDLVLLCAACEMDAEIARLVGQVQGRADGGSPSFGLALGLLDAPHWSALSPDAPLRRLRVLEFDRSRPLCEAPLKLDERVLHLVAGINLMDARLQPLLLRAEPPTLMAPTHARLADQLVESWRARGTLAGVVLLHGDDAEGQEDVASAAADALARALYVLRMDDVPRGAQELEAFVELWEREARVLPALLLLQCGESIASADALQLMRRLRVPLVVAMADPMAIDRLALSMQVQKPGPREREALWQAALGPSAEAMEDVSRDLSDRFRLGARSIQSLARTGSPRDSFPDALNAGCAVRARKRLDELARRIEPRAGWDDLVLPESSVQPLRQMAVQLRQRERVFGDWGFSAASARGMGMSALFHGESGTGKTMAAEVLARELKRELYCIDLSSVVSKYIGETEKNLRRVFDAAEDCGAILLFDEADALFGKRSEVRDSHDRYANIEVGYLLARMEAYQGLAILTTNLKSSLDGAFLRRLRFVVNFPFPDQALRGRIWRRSFPPTAPLAALDYDKLSRLHMPGGSIRNIALNAAFLAAEAGEPIGMSQLLVAARGESAKLERPLAEAETRGWA